MYRHNDREEQTAFDGYLHLNLTVYIILKFQTQPPELVFMLK